MNAVVTTPATELRVECNPTREYPRLLIVSRAPNYVHVTLMARPTRKSCFELVGVASGKPKDVDVKLDGPKSWLRVGDASFAVSQSEAERLRNELQLPVKVAP